jgi:predicted metalloendopeptidase
MNYDFYNYINKDWIINNPIPNDKSKWSQFDILNESNYIKLKNIFDNKLSNNNKLKIIYKQLNSKYNNINIINKYFLQIDSFDNILDLFKFTIELSLLFNIDNIYHFDIYSNFYNSSVNILFIDTGGLGLPSKDYYFKENKQDIRNEYKLFIKEYLELFNLNLNYKKIYLLEEKLAFYTLNPEEARDINIINNIRNFDEINEEFPILASLINYFLVKFNKSKKEINIINPNFIKYTEQLLIPEMLSLWKDFIKYKIALSVYFLINNDIENKYLEFYQIKLEGLINISPKWKRSINIINNILGQDLGKLYVSNYYSPKSHKIINVIFKCIYSVIKKSIKENNWLTEETKTKALLKLKNINIKIGYPDNRGLYDYSNLIVNKNNNILENYITCFYYNKLLNIYNLYKPVNKYRWFMHPQITNAYYSPSHNEIVFPAAILQEPFLFENNIIKSFAGIGFIIGHEIIHAFDNKGRLFDENGNYFNWWNNNDNIEYNKIANKLIDQYNTYTIFNENINGKLTLGENIADLDGFKFALKGIEYYCKLFNYKITIRHYQLFFTSFANILACNIREEKQKQLLLIDPHSPNIYRVNGVLRNIKKFYEVYNIQYDNDFINIF